MKHQRSLVLALLSVLLFGSLASASAQAAEQRLALVVGNANYSSGVLPTPANDAGLIAQTLQAAGFDVVGVRDLDQDSLRRTFRDFIAKVSAAGPDTVAFVYLSGYGLQLEGENYFVPTDANIARDVNVSSEAYAFRTTPSRSRLLESRRASSFLTGLVPTRSPNPVLRLRVAWRLSSRTGEP